MDHHRTQRARQVGEEELLGKRNLLSRPPLNTGKRFGSCARRYLGRNIVRESIGNVMARPTDFRTKISGA